MRKVFGFVMATIVGLGAAVLPVHADDNKDELLNLIRQKDGKLAAVAVDKLFTFNMSPAWWAWFLKPETQGYHTLRNLADALMEFGVHEGGDDPRKFDEKRDASSPLVADALDKLAARAHITIDFNAPVTDQYLKTVAENFDLISNPIGESFCCKPRGHKLHLTITVDPKAKAFTSTVSKDGNDYHFMLPAYVGVSTSPIEEAFKKGT